MLPLTHSNIIFSSFLLFQTSTCLTACCQLLYYFSILCRTKETQMWLSFIPVFTSCHIMLFNGQKYYSNSTTPVTLWQFSYYSFLPPMCKKLLLFIELFMLEKTLSVQPLTQVSQVYH